MIAVNVLAIGASWSAFRRSSGVARRFWILFGTASLFQLCGNVGWEYVRIAHLTVTSSALFPSMFYRLYAGPMAIALFLSEDRRGSRLTRFLDDCIVVGLVGMTMYQVQMAEVAAKHPRIWQTITITSGVNTVLLLAVVFRWFLCSSACLRRLYARQLVYLFTYFCVAIETSVADAYFPLLDRFSGDLWVLTYAVAATLAISWHPSISRQSARPAAMSRRASLLCFNLTLATLVFASAVLGLRLVDSTRIVGMAGMAIVLFSFAVRSALMQDTQEQLLSELNVSRAELRRQALYDDLTGLPNRRLLGDRLAQALAVARRESTLLAILFVDLDGFKPINDRLGHAQGDRVLVEIARRMRSRMRESDTVARVGGDEFTILMTHVTARSQVESLSRSICEALSEPMPTGDELLTVTASIGIAIFPEDSEDAASLMELADQAMYAAKNDSQERVRS